MKNSTALKITITGIVVLASTFVFALLTLVTMNPNFLIGGVVALSLGAFLSYLPKMVEERRYRY